MKDLEFKVMLIVLTSVLSLMFLAGVFGIAHLFLKFLG